MKTIIAHPDNIKVAKAEYRKACPDRHPSHYGLRFKSDESIPRTRKTGLFVLPGGKPVPPDEVRIETRFVEYGPEDIPFLLFAGIISEEEEMLFYLVRDEMFRPSMELRPGLLEQRTAYAKTCWP